MIIWHCKRAYIQCCLYCFHVCHSSGSYNQPIWSTYFSSNASSTCFISRNSCPSSSIRSCSHSEDVTIACCKYCYTTTIIHYIIIIAYSSSIANTATVGHCNIDGGNSHGASSAGTKILLFLINLK